MADPIYFAPLRVPIVDQRTGLMAREWYLFFQALWLRTGGVEAPTNTDILQSLTEGLSVADVVPTIDRISQEFGQLPQSELSELMKETLTSSPPVFVEVSQLLQDLSQDPSLQSQVLPHLQYGTWTPTDASGAGLSLTVSSATYVKHERLVLARCTITYPATANGSNAVLGGLPFIVDNFDSARQGWISFSNNSTLRYFLPVNNTATANFYTSAGVIMTNAQLSGSAHYLAALYTTP